ncbi:MAG TPA: glycosyltransferase family 39 protein, partial [Verrucomicrobiae bacterium]|nr:glycosyltransferase family 39 protein [Verrucomicrobiae bacterium]
MIFASKSHGGFSGDLKNFRRENLLAGMLLIFAFALRLIFIFHYRVNSDEPQHLHVVWAWAHGFLPYRDVFDNHSPLFSLLWAPVFNFFGERVDIVSWMRLTELPCYVLSLWAVFRIASTLFDRRTGLWATVLAALWPVFFFGSLEFRPDGLWAACWLLALAVLIEGQVTLGRGFIVGFLLGITMAISMKTILMLIALGVGLTVAMIVAGRNGRKFSFARLSACLAAAVAGFLILPVGVVLFFASKNALGPLFYGTIGHNLLAHSASHISLWLRALYFLAAFVSLVCMAFIIFRRSGAMAIGGRRVLIFVTTLTYFLLLVCFWPIIEREHYLPFYPLLMVLLAGAIFSLPRGEPKWHVPKFILPVSLAVLELCWVIGMDQPWRNRTTAESRLLADVLTLTDPTDTIMDKKGE